MSRLTTRGRTTFPFPSLNFLQQKLFGKLLGFLVLLFPQQKSKAVEKSYSPRNLEMSIEISN